MDVCVCVCVCVCVYSCVCADQNVYVWCSVESVCLFQALGMTVMIAWQRVAVPFQLPGILHKPSR